MRLRSEEELKAGLDDVLKEHRADDGRSLSAGWPPSGAGIGASACGNGAFEALATVLASCSRWIGAAVCRHRLQGRRPRSASKIIPVWRREMRGNGYLARWVSAITAEGPVRAITFVVNRGSERYAGRLSDQEIAAQIALACGHIGPSAEYLLNTVTRCEELGVHDPYLWRMQALVAERMSADRLKKL